MEIRDLSIFIAVAKTGSVTRAAEQLGYVQSNITARIQKLSTSLLHRLPRGVSLTTSGETLFRYAEQILHLCHEAELAVQDSETPVGTLRIGTMETTAATRLPAILAKYHDAFPDVELSLTTGPTNQLLHAVVNYEAEIALVAGPIEHPQLEQVAVIKEDLVLVSKSQNINLSSTTSDLTVLAFREGCSYRKKLEQYLDHIGIQSRKVIEMGTIDGILGCVGAGLGIAFVPRTFTENGRHHLVAHELPREFSKVPTVLVRRKDAFVSPALSRFVEMVQQSIDQAPEPARKKAEQIS